MQEVLRRYIENKDGVSAKMLERELSEVFKIRSIVRIFTRLDIIGIPQESCETVLGTLFDESSGISENLPIFPETAYIAAFEPLEGRFDSFAFSCEESIRLLGDFNPAVKTATVCVFDKLKFQEDFERIKEYLINPLEFAEINIESETPPLTAYADLSAALKAHEPVLEVRNYADLKLAMSEEDVKTVQEYFGTENRRPTLAEMRLLDAFRSENSSNGRRAAFNTTIKKVDIQDKRVIEAYQLFKSVNGGRSVTLANVASAAAQGLEAGGESAVDNLFFNVESNNTQTEREPSSGASNCIGGAILGAISAGGAKICQAMRIVGGGDPRQPIETTLKKKTPQRKIALTAAEGFSSYSNRVGVNIGYAREIYHPGYIAKRMEAAAVISVADCNNSDNLKKSSPASGDLMVLIGEIAFQGKSGKSKTKNGSPYECRKIQKLFQNGDFSKLIKKSVKVGAGTGGIVVSLIKLAKSADGIKINLDEISEKTGFDGTKSVLAELNQNLAVVIAESDLSAFSAYCEADGVNNAVIGEIADSPRIVVNWRGQKIIDIAKDFIVSGGAKRHADVKIPSVGMVHRTVKHLNSYSQKGLIERFDASAGSSSVFAPLGGKYAFSQPQIMASILPDGFSKGKNTAAAVSFGFEPYHTETDPFGGSVYAVINSVAKLVAAGIDLSSIRLSLLEYFPKLGGDSEKWGTAFAAMLGAFSAQMGLKIPAVSSRDCMTGSFGEFQVPPTLISFAYGTGDAEKLISPEFKKAGSPVYIIETPMSKEYYGPGVKMPDYGWLLEKWEKYSVLVKEGKVLAAQVCESSINDSIRNMSLGNLCGFTSNEDGEVKNMTSSAIIFEAAEELRGFELLGRTLEIPEFNYVSLGKMLISWENPLEKVFPSKLETLGFETPTKHTIIDIVGSENSEIVRIPYGGAKFAQPTAVIPVFAATNGECDVVRGLERAGAKTEIVRISGKNQQNLNQAATTLEKAIENAQMLILPSGLGSANMISAMFSEVANPRIFAAVKGLLARDGLILGIDDGFKALLKLGLLDVKANLAANNIGQRRSKMVTVRVCSTMSPWLGECNAGEVYTQPISCSSGRFSADLDTLESLQERSMIAFQYDDYDDSAWGIEAVSSQNGRVLGKMSHFERYSEFSFKNTHGNRFLPLFEGGVKYFI